MSEHNVGMAMHGDKVLIKISGGRGNRIEGKVLKVLERRRIEYVGTVHQKDGRAILVADDQKIRKPFFIQWRQDRGEGDH